MILSRLASRRRWGKRGSGIKEREMDGSAWQDLIGRTESRSDSVDPAPLARWLATLDRDPTADGTAPQGFHWRSEEHTSELQSLMRISYAVFCLKKKKK